MSRITAIFISCLVVLLPGLAGAAAKDPCPAVVLVVSLDDEGQPQRQGLGVVVRKDGTILTSAHILAPSRKGLIKNGDGSFTLIRRILHWDAFQDLALVKVEAEDDFKAAPLGNPGILKPGDQVRVGSREKDQGKLSEARVVKALPFSPRLVLIKLEPANLATQIGAPIFDGRGEVVGMLHSFAQSGQTAPCQFVLARDRTQMPPEKGLEDKAPAAPEAKDEDSAVQPALAFWEGVTASFRQDWGEAQKKFTLALAPPGTLVEAYYGRGVARYHLKDYDGAIKDFSEATRRAPAYALACLWLGKTRERQGNGPGAAEAYLQAVKISPDLSEASFLLGLSALRQGQLEEASRYLEQAGDDFPECAQKWWHLGRIAQAQKRHEEALAAFKRAIQLEPQFFQAHLDAGSLLLVDLGRSQEAIDLLREAVRLDPRQPSARYWLALAQITAWHPGPAWEQYFALQKLDANLAMRLATTLEKYH